MPELVPQMGLGVMPPGFVTENRSVTHWLAVAEKLTPPLDVPTNVPAGRVNGLFF